MINNITNSREEIVVDNQHSDSVNCLSWKKEALKLAIDEKIFEKDPLILLYNLDHFRSLAREANEQLGGIQSMAIKSNPVMGLMKEAVRCGLGAEVASFGELKIAEAAGFPVEKIIYDSPIKSQEELEYALNLGVKLNVDNFQELDRIIAIVEKMSAEKLATVCVGIRVNPQVAAGKYQDLSTGVPTSKFGIGMENSERIVQMYQTYKWLNNVHLHVGSQGFEMSQTSDAIVKVFELVEHINQLTNKQIRFFNIGGGLSVNFDSEKDTPTFSQYAAHLREKLPRLFSGDYVVISEFGRSYFAKSGVVVSKVEYTKQSGGRDIGVIHAGANLFIRTIYQHPLWKLRVTAFSHEGQYLDGSNGSSIYDLAGPCCFAADLLVKERKLPHLNPNDFIMVHDSGAYMYSSYSHYNLRLAPPIYAIDSEVQNLRLIKKGETIEDKIRFFS
ncbi:group IV decarboxylase [Heterostelium album PN500]|uniref:Group IV decarboxylase n=1 Tax=Heterostelium pallidum (strain ATCC 26659 / Pp 5 / PN500) TaxID=670386 RepID=D3BE71_HETP5|nr:group IV decarboxylase [Heterostelium album PN500]EFA80202.1 group IV decarboxylase [Heterostelium album PN500]|eukprot:XP_020432322.1 group IV decarboxylase [Heterostelium album PN500]